MMDSALATANVTPSRMLGSRSSAEFAQYKELLLMLSWRDITIRYKQSVMGFAWAVLMPILIVGSGLIVTVAFSTISHKPIQRIDILSVAVKAVPWAFFVGAIRFSTNSLIMNKELVTKIYFPREILPLSSVLANLFDMTVAAGVLVPILWLAKLGASIYLLWVPILLAILVLLTVAFAILLSCANLFFRDVKYLVEVILTYGVFFTPVFYSANALGKWGPLLLLNPIGPLLEGFRDTMVLQKSPDLRWVAYSALCAGVGFAVSWKVFKRTETAFAESI